MIRMCRHTFASLKDQSMILKTLFERQETFAVETEAHSIKRLRLVETLVRT